MLKIHIVVYKIWAWRIKQLSMRKINQDAICMLLNNQTNKNNQKRNRKSQRYSLNEATDNLDVGYQSLINKKAYGLEW